MKSIKKTAIVAGILTAILVPAMTFAATATGSLGMTRTAPDFTKLPQTVQDTLKAQGVTVPTQAELQAFATKMANEKKARSTLSDADKATIKAIMEKAHAEERAFLRTKGIELPSEDEIAKMKKFKESLQTTIGALPYAEAKKLKKEFRTEMGQGGMMKEMRGGHGMGKKGGREMNKSMEQSAQ
jgi:hypothetical protein